MAVLGTLLMAAGAITAFVGGIWLLIVIFQESIVWGIASLIIPFVGLIFVIMNWDKAGKPFLIQLAGAVPMFIGAMMQGPHG